MRSQRLSVHGLGKSYGRARAVDDLSFAVEPGRVTGLLGPNGAGKTTTMRVMLGLVSATTGTALVGGVPYRRLRAPLTVVGSLLDANAVHGGRTGRNHLRVVCASAGLPASRVGTVLELVGLGTVADRKVKGYSLGMRQRLGIATALLGEPRILVLDEPANGLDPEGIHWLRTFLRAQAAEGRTVLVSSHLLAEMQLMADDVVIIAGGRLVTHGAIRDVLDAVPTRPVVHVRSPQAAELARALGPEVRVDPVGPDGLTVHGASAETIGRVACQSAVELHELRSEAVDLERAFLDLTSGKAAIR